MKKSILLISFLTIIVGGIFAQAKVYNNSAKIIINDNIYMQADNFINDNSGEVFLEGGMTIRNDLENNNIFSIANTGSLISGTVSGSSECSFNKEINVDNQHYISIPITTANATIFTGAFAFKYDEQSSNWLTLNSSDQLNIMCGYSVDYSVNSNIEFIGTLNTGEYSYDVTKLGDGWNLVGNPFCSAIDWDATSGWTKNNIDNTIYFWDGNQYSYYVGGSGSGVNGGTNIIPATQGFFVKANSAGLLGLTNEVRIHDEQNFYKNNNNEQNIRLTAYANNFADETLISFNQEATNGFDNNLEAYKLFSTNNSVPNLYSFNNIENINLSINAIPEITEQLVIPINFKVGKSGIYSIEATEINIVDMQQIYLYDKKQDVYTDLTIQPEYSFVYDKNENQDRFLLTFTKNTSTTNDINTTDINIYAFEKNVYVDFKHDISFKNVKITIYNIMGETIKIVNTNKNKVIIPINYQTGTYIVEIITDNNIKRNTIVIH